MTRSEKRRQFTSVLKALYDRVLSEPVPQSIDDTLRGLK